MFVTKEEKQFKRNVGKRKHVSQMSQYEINGLMNRLKKLKSDGNISVMTHAFDRMDEKGIFVTQKDIISMIGNSSIVEYKIDERDNTYVERLVICSNATVNKSYKLKVVFDFTKKSVVTVWLNHVTDKHSTLDWSLYDKNMKVFGI